jgi:hypothetical protein
LNPDSAVAFHRKCEAQSFRNKVDGFVALIRYQSTVLLRAAEIPRNDFRKRKMALKLQSRTPSLLQDCALFSSDFGLIAESRLNSTPQLLAGERRAVAQDVLNIVSYPRLSFAMRL